MFNVAVINLKNLLKILVKMIIAIAIIAMIFFWFPKPNLKGIGKFNTIYLGLISSNLVISEINFVQPDFNLAILGSEFTLFDEEECEFLSENLIEVSNNEKLKIEEVANTNQEAIEISKVEPKVSTEVISSHNKNDVYTDTYGSVKIKNESKYELTPEMLQPTVDFNNKQDILIFHTHTCESYTPTENKNYVASR